MGRPGTATEKGIDMKDLTPAHMRCGPRNCPSVRRLEDGQLLIVGKTAWKILPPQQMTDLGCAEDEEAVIISPDLLSDYVAGEVAALKAENARLANALENLLTRHCELVESGDCGFWDVEQESEVVEARKVLDANSPAKSQGK